MFFERCHQPEQGLLLCWRARVLGFSLGVEAAHITDAHAVGVVIGAVGTRLLRKNPYIAWIPPVISNMAIVPIVLQRVYGVEDAWWYLVLTVGIGEVISCGVLGLLLYHSVRRIPQLK